MASQSDILRAGFGSPAVTDRLRERPSRLRPDEASNEPAEGLEGRKQRLDERRTTERERPEAAGAARNDPAANERASKRREGGGASFEERLAREAEALERHEDAAPTESTDEVADEDATANESTAAAEVVADPESLIADALATTPTLVEDVEAPDATTDESTPAVAVPTAPTNEVAEPVAPTVTDAIEDPANAVDEPPVVEDVTSEHESALSKTTRESEGVAKAAPAIDAATKDAAAAPAVVVAAAASAHAVEAAAPREASEKPRSSTAAATPFDAASFDDDATAEALTEAPVAPVSATDATVPERSSEASSPEVRIETAAAPTIATETPAPHRAFHAVEAALPDASTPAEARAAAPEMPARAEFRSIEEAREILSQWRLHVAPESEQVLLELRPAALGSIAIQLRVDAGRVEAIVRSPRRASLDALRAREGELRSELERSGLAAERITFELGDAPNESSSENPSRSSAAARALQNALVLERAREGLDTYA